MRRILNLCWEAVSAALYGFFAGWKFWHGIARDEENNSE